MKYFISGFFLLCVLTPTAFAGSCYHCHQRNSDTCKEEGFDCEGDSQCIVISDYTEIGSSIHHSIYKGCARDLPCDAVLYATTDKSHIRVNYQCCSGNNCNTNNYEMPPDTGEPSGRLCPSCFSNTLETCTSDRQIMCRGPEDRCFAFRGRGKDPDGVEDDYAAKGCTSPIACDMGFGALAGVQEMFHVAFNCT